MKKILVLGLGISGRAAANFLLKKGISVHGLDSNQTLLYSHPEIASLQQKGLTYSYDYEKIDLDSYDTVIVSPGVSRQHPLYIKAQSKKMRILGEIELACQYVKGEFLGITGTNGKTTVTLLVTHVLNRIGRDAYALGNVGTPLISQVEELAQKKGICVVELSSYQLETMTQPVIDAAVLLNITPDHLDRYTTMEEYAKAKLQIGLCLKPQGELFVEENCWKQFGHILPGLKANTYGYSSESKIFTDLNHILRDNKVETVLPSKLQGKKSHDLENVLAAYALCQYVGVSPKQFIDALKSFKKPAHRIEFVKTIKGVSYYDDSKGTNLDAVIRAVESLEGNIILIAGGVDKGASYKPWISAFKEKVKNIMLIGEAAQKIEKELSHAFVIKRFISLREAVIAASKIAKKGDIVLLSPGCSSFDMFRDYAHRGEEYQLCVRNL